jgi:hypothetical protein
MVGVLVHFPGAGWNLSSLGVAYVPGVALTAVAGALGGQRR